MALPNAEHVACSDSVGIRTGARHAILSPYVLGPRKLESKPAKAIE